MTKSRSKTKQLVAFDDDLLIPPPREASKWYCTKCGEPTGEPESGMLLVDRRYAIGHCPCTPIRVNRKTGTRHEMINLIADFAWDPEEHRARIEKHKEQLAYEKQAAGMGVTPEDAARAARYRIRNGLPPIERRG